MSEKEKKAIKIVKKLKAKDHIAYFAGGCVRDMLMKSKPADIDIATDATPDEVEKILPKTIPVGKKFGVVIAVEDSDNFEVATFRAEKGFTDARRPDKVSWSGPEEDAKRRDFTVNGLFYDPIAKKVIDYVEGQKDIAAKLLRFIGEPDERIKEDHLRIIRAVRFKNALGFEYEPKTEKAIRKNAEQVKDVSAERIRAELDKIIVNETRVQALRDLSDFGILKVILPELETMKGSTHPQKFHAEGDVWEHTLLCLENLPKKPTSALAWAVLLHDVGKPNVREEQPDGRITFYKHTHIGAKITKAICTRLKFSRAQADEIVWLVKNHLHFKDLPKMKPVRQIRFINHPYIKNLLAVSFIDSSSSYLGEKDKLDFELYDYAKKMFDAEAKKPKIKKLVSGYDVMEILGLKPGPPVGKVLKKIEDEQMIRKITTKKQAFDYLKQLKQD